MALRPCYDGKDLAQKTLEGKGVSGLDLREGRFARELGQMYYLGERRGLIRAFLMKYWDYLF